MLKKLIEEPQKVYRTLFILISLSIFFIMLKTSFDYGITWDEWNNSNTGAFILRYLLSGGKDKFVLGLPIISVYSGLFYGLVDFTYGALFDTVRGFISEGLYQDHHLLAFFTTSHVINALFGFLAILYTGFLAKEIGGWRTGLVAILFMALSPRFWGNSMNNPKDIPFAAGSIFFLYYTIRFIKELPKPSMKTMALIAMGMAASIGTRPGGLLLIGYFFLFTLFAWFDSSILKKQKINPLYMTASILGIALLGYLGGLVFWPYGQLNPIVNPLLALKQMTQFSFWNGRVLFEGALIPATQLPWYYLPKWILISSPLFLITSLCLFFLALRPLLKNFDGRLLGMIFFSAVFPLVYAIYKESTTYDAWRHFMFVYPPIIVIAAAAWENLFRILKTWGQKILLTGVLLLHLGEPLSWMVQNHPHEYVYFNATVGGLRGAFGRYETDYWGNCLRFSAEWLAEHHQKVNGNQPLVVRADGHLMSSYPYLRERLGSAYIPYLYPEGFKKPLPYLYLPYPSLKTKPVPGKDNWDYALSFSRGWSPEDLSEGRWPPPDTVYRIETDNVTLCAVVKNPNTQLE